jgi:ribonuclease-3 family protein
MKYLSEDMAKQYSPLTLAFLGDSVYEIQVRCALTAEANRPVGSLHSEKIRYVCAAFQARAADFLQDAMNDAELAVYRRGRNAGGTPSKNADPADYRKATGFEAVFGYLYLTGNTERIEMLFGTVWENKECFL